MLFITFGSIAQSFELPSGHKHAMSTKCLTIHAVDKRGSKQAISKMVHNKPQKSIRSISHDAFRFYQYSDSAESIVIFESGIFISQIVKVIRCGVLYKVFNTRSLPDTSTHVFEIALKRFKPVLDTISMIKDVSEISLSILKDETIFDVAVTRKYFLDNKVVRELKVGNEPFPSRVEWKYLDQDVIIKTFYNEKGQKIKVTRFKNHLPIEEEFFGIPFGNTRRILEYDSLNRVKAFKRFDGDFLVTAREYFFDHASGRLVRTHEKNAYSKEDRIEIYEYLD